MTKRKNEMSEHERNLFDNSIERVINTTIRILNHVEQNFKLEGDIAEDVDINIQDWIALKETTTYWWNEARNEAFKKYNNQVITTNTIASGADTTSLNIVVKRHIQLLGKMHNEGKRVYEALEAYIRDCVKENMIVLSNAQEIYDTFIDGSGIPRDKRTHSYKVNVWKFKRVIQQAIDDKDLKTVIVSYHNRNNKE
jgi:hypothetical protein